MMYNAINKSGPEKCRSTIQDLTHTPGQAVVRLRQIIAFTNPGDHFFIWGF